MVITMDEEKGTEICTYQAGSSKTAPDFYDVVIWNANGLLARMHDGGLAELMACTNPDVLAVTEVKKNPDAIAHKRDMYAGLIYLGYHHIAFNYCHGEPNSSSKNGIMVASKFKLDNMEFGVNARAERSSSAIESGSNPLFARSLSTRIMNLGRSAV